MAIRVNDLVGNKAVKESLFISHEASAIELNSVTGRVSLLESMLMQRQEEIVQAWRELDEQKLKFEELNQALVESMLQREELERKLKDTDGWVFKLSGERMKIEHKLGMLETKTEKLSKRCLAAEEAVSDTRSRLDASLNELKEVRREHEKLIESARHDRDALNKYAETSAHNIESLKENFEYLLDESSKEKRSLEEKLKDSLSNTANMEMQIKEQAEKIAIYTKNLENSSKNIEALNILLQERDESLGRSETKCEWLRNVLVTITKEYSRSNKIRLISMAPSYIMIEKQIKNLKKSGLFDDIHYKSIHPDVAESGIHPLRHYIIHGLSEGRAIRDD